MARPPKPTHLKIVEGNPGKRALPKNEPKPTGNLANPPTYLDKEEKAEWRYVLKHAPDGLLKMLDTAVMEVYVTARIQHRKALKQLREEGLTLTTSNGNLITNPLVGVLNRQAEIALKAATQMGFTPVSRARVALDETPEKSGFEQFEG